MTARIGHYFLPLLGTALVALTLNSYAQDGNKAATPEPRNDWMIRHQQYVDVIRKGDAKVIFLGDSITEGWGGRGKTLWQELYAPLKAVNLGIGGDRTENVLWRLQNGELEGARAKAIMLMIGTNNTARNSAKEIADGVKAIVEEIKARCPETKILLLGIFPRSFDAKNPLRAKISEINSIISALNDEKTVFYLDIGQKFLEPDGALSPEIMPDALHLSEKGYQIWSNAVAEKLSALLK